MDLEQVYVPGFGGPRECYNNSQRANRRLWNPLHNFINGLPVDEILTLDSVPTEGGGYRSATIPQYVTNTYLRKVSFRIGVLKDNIFDDRSEDCRFTSMIRKAIFGIVCFPQRPEYLQRNLADESTSRRPVTSCLDHTLERHALLGSEAADFTFYCSVCAAFAVDSCLTDITFPVGYGLKLDYSDVVLLDYAWTNPTEMTLGTGEACVLEVTYFIDDLGLPVELESDLVEYGLDLSYSQILLGRDPVTDLSINWFVIDGICPGKSRRTIRSNEVEIDGAICIYILPDNHCSSCCLVGESRRMELLNNAGTSRSYHECFRDNTGIRPGYYLHEHDGHKICQKPIFCAEEGKSMNGMFHLEVTVDNPHEDAIMVSVFCVVYSELKEWPTQQEHQHGTVFLDSPLDCGKRIYYIGNV